MHGLLLAVIYLAFISLGLPDSLLGSAWPIMQSELGAPLSFAGIVSMIIAGSTIVSSLSSDRMTRRLGAGPVTAVSVLMTAAALFGFSTCTAFWQLCIWAIPYGLGAGAVDAALNNYVAIHYAARHMSWLHCFWGVGAAISPFIMSAALAGSYGWKGGYAAVSLLQIVLTSILFLSLPLWKKRTGTTKDGVPAPALTLGQIFKIRGVPYILCAFFGYCALETTAGLWASSYLVSARGIDAGTSARYASLFYLGITAGRFLCGFVTDRLGDRNMIRIGLGVLTAGVLAVALPVPMEQVCLWGLVLVGFGCAPVYPSVIHATPTNFGEENSQAIVGVQMASAYAGSTLMPPLFGLVANHIHIGLYPFFLMVFIVLMIVMTEKLNRMVPEAKP